MPPGEVRCVWNTTARPSRATAAAASPRSGSRPQAARFAGNDCGSNGSSSTSQPSVAAGRPRRCDHAALSPSASRSMPHGVTQPPWMPARPRAASAPIRHSVVAVRRRAWKPPSTTTQPRSPWRSRLSSEAPPIAPATSGRSRPPGKARASTRGCAAASTARSTPSAARGGVAIPITRASQPNCAAAPSASMPRGSKGGASKVTRSPQRISMPRRQPGAVTSSCRTAGACARAVAGAASGAISSERRSIR